jgi:ribosome-associated heat shock protein Hsp15
MTDGKLRIDKLLWYLRLTKTRALAQRMVRDGQIRIDRDRAASAHANVGIGQTVTIILGDRMQVVRIDTLPTRRGPAPEAQGCYTVVHTN